MLSAASRTRPGRFVPPDEWDPWAESLPRGGEPAPRRRACPAAEGLPRGGGPAQRAWGLPRGGRPAQRAWGLPRAPTRGRPAPRVEGRPRAAAGTLTAMSSRRLIVLGMLAGLGTGAVTIAAIVALAITPWARPTDASVVPASSLAASPAGPGGSPTPAGASPGIASPAASATPSAAASDLPPAGSSPSASGNTAFRVGQSAPPLVVPRMGGGTIDLTELRGRPVWVNFMGTYCPECRDEFPLMSGFAARYAETGLAVVAVDVREDEATVAAFATEVGAIFPIGLDSDGAAQRAWGAYGLPVHYWIDADGIVRYGALGGIGPDLMARGLGSILPGVSVSP